MNTPNDGSANTPEEETARRGEKARERSAEERSIVAPTPADVRAKAEGSQDEEDEEDEEDEDKGTEEPQVDAQAP
ncbi:hypothetical protein GCM10018790_15450 [Kitasatospora xanthocidica]|uniref:hypothetical protein n=1 Tax=Kitasatospora xanthocidica TaxID=83382 RepID=UPI001676D5E2|nr:hypothetical protein [Kitasatospora xanthocidica]GHF38632.1 hypothetical protein GCM10018790_15450 [Kitasatospora xanthocidica]